MTCPRCQKENPGDAVFCQECGTRLETGCASCGTANQLGAKFCKKCGQRLSGPQAEHAVPGPRFGKPESYTPKHLAEKILTSKAALEGERKQVTVLFADLKGSMELLADRDPEEARRLLDPVLERMMEAVHQYEGTVNQVMGDGIMALFGAPIGHEDHAVRACYAALRMQRRVNLHADEVQQQGGTPVQIRVGVNSGEVVVRVIGSDLRMDYTAVGQTTHLAARMEQMAKPGSALVTGATLNLAEGYVQVRPLGAVPVKGLATPMPVYELTGTGPARSRLHASAARGLTHFVGRDPELEQLGQALERAAAGHGQAVAVVGEAGVGKSRLVWEFTRSHRTHGWLVLESGSVSYGKATPYLPIIELLKSYCRIQERDEPRDIRERVAGKLLTLDRSLEPLLTPLLALLDVPIEDPAWASLDPPQRRQRTLEAVKRLLLRESQVQPLLLIFEDLHWIDTETEALLDGLIESLPTTRVLLLVNYRPEYQHAWGGKTYYLQLRIDPLPPESADTLLTALLGEDGTLAPLKRALIARTEGNPFFLEENVRTLVETQVLVGERGAYRVTTAPEAWQIPATVQAILAARIDRLAPEDKRLLQAAAVIGKDVPFALLQAIADVPEDTLRWGLSHLQAAEFLYETSLFPDLEYTFKHAFTHEVGSGSVLQDRRRVLHARIVEAIEALYPERLTEYVERLAHHAVRGELWEKAVGYLSQAGQRAMWSAALRESVGYFEQAVDALVHLPETPRHLDQGIDLRLLLRNGLYVLGEHERVLRHLREAELVATKRGDPARLARVLGYVSTHFVFTEAFEEALDYGTRALDLARASGDGELEIEMTGRVALSQVFLGDYGPVIAELRSILPRVREETPRPRFFGLILTAVMILDPLAQVLAERGEFDEATLLADEAIRRAEQLDPRYSLATACYWAGRVHLRRGELARATELLERSLGVCRAVSAAAVLPLAASHLGWAYALLDRHAEALPLLLEAVEKGARGWEQSLQLVMLGEVYLQAGRVLEASEVAERTLVRVRERHERGTEAWALRLLGEVTLLRDESVARGHFEAALTLATDLGMRPLVAHSHLGLGKLHRRTGDRASALEHLSTAATMYREMEMGFWLEKAEGALKEAGQ